MDEDQEESSNIEQLPHIFHLPATEGRGVTPLFISLLSYFFWRALYFSNALVEFTETTNWARTPI